MLYCIWDQSFMWLDWKCSCIADFLQVFSRFLKLAHTRHQGVSHLASCLILNYILIDAV